METGTLVELDGQYRALREGAGLVDRSQRGQLAARGGEAAEYLQGQLTNDVEALEPGGGCYAALLDRKGHIQCDLRVLRIGPAELWLDTEAQTADRLRKHLDTYKIGRDVEIADMSGEYAILSLIGPASETVSGSGPLSAEFAHRDHEGGRAVATELGIDLIVPAADAPAARKRLLAAGAVEVSEAATEIVRVERGRPRYGAEMSEATMPAEAGIDARAVSFTKGCYIGQEPVARLHYKGKPNRHLRGLRLEAPARAGDPIRLGDRELGRVGTAVLSPALGSIALAIVRREAGPGDVVEVGETRGEVVELPF